MTLISVIVPVYNVENYLKECVDSILNQTFKDFELILIDDGSTDNSGVLCDKFADLDPRVKVIHKKNEKQGAARNCGVRFAKSDLISFVDSDDYISSTYLEDLYKVYRNNDSSIVCCDYIKGRNGVAFDSENNSCNLTKITVDDTEMSNLFKKGNYFWICWCKLIKKDFLLKYPFPEGVYYEDNAVVFKWIHECGKLTILDKKLYFYRINNSGTTKGANRHEVDYINALENQMVFFANENYNKTAKLVFNEYLKYTNYVYYKRKIRTKNEAQTIKNRTRFFIKTYGYLLEKDQIYGNRIVHPLRGQFYRLYRNLKRACYKAINK